ncbi:MAG TPA: cytochrome c oxidase subunit II [Micromonosporaceae bacterium]
MSVAMLGAISALVLTGCSVDQAFSFGWPQGITAQARRMHGLWIGSTIAALIVGVIVWGLIFWCIIRYHKRKTDTELPPQTRYNLPIELVYTVIPFLVIAVLFFYTAVNQTSVDKISANPQVTIDITAFKWNWQFSYEGQDNVDSSGNQITTIGDSDYIPVLVVPAGQTILFKEHAQDVIHSFWVPALLFKRDVFPGDVHNSFEVTIDSDKTGAYVGRCAELCGTYHSQMNFEMRVVSPADYDAYLKARRNGLSTPEALAQIGQQPYATTTEPFDTSRGQQAPNP